MATLVPLVIAAIVMGMYPKPFLEMIEEPVNAIVARVRPGYFEGTGVTPPSLPTTEGALANMRARNGEQLASLEDLLQQQLAEKTDADATPEN